MCFLGRHSGASLRAEEIVMQWGMDLNMFSEDHRARNISSYQPDGVPRVWALDGHTAINFVRSLWEALEPSPACRFDAIDRHILRISLKTFRWPLREVSC